MRVFAHPFRIASDGSAATIEQWTDDEARQVVGLVLGIFRGTSRLGPEWGIDDPAGVGLTAGEVQATIELCEPELEVTGVTVEPTTGGRQRVLVAAQWIPEEG